MKRVSATFAALVLLSQFCNSAYAAEQWIISKIRSVYPQANGDFVIMFDDDHSGCTSTETSKYYYVSVGVNSVTSDGRDVLLSVALASAATRVSVQAAFDDSTSSCYINRLAAVFDE